MQSAAPVAASSRPDAKDLLADPAADPAVRWVTSLLCSSRSAGAGGYWFWQDQRTSVTERPQRPRRRRRRLPSRRSASRHSGKVAPASASAAQTAGETTRDAGSDPAVPSDPAVTSARAVVKGRPPQARGGPLRGKRGAAPGSSTHAGRRAEDHEPRVLTRSRLVAAPGDTIAIAVLELRPNAVIAGSCGLLRQLGKADGRVWAARHVALDTDVAVKALRPERVAADPSLVTRFEREAKGGPRASRIARGAGDGTTDDRRRRTLHRDGALAGLHARRAPRARAAS